MMSARHRSGSWLVAAAIVLLVGGEAWAVKPVAIAGQEEPLAPATPPAAAPDDAKANENATGNAEPPGQEDLNAAIDAKLEINDLDDFGRVIDLCKRAIDKGLDADSKKFAEDLYTGTLIDRAAMLVSAIFDTDEPDPQWKRIRSFAMRDLNEVVARDPGFGTAHLMIARLEALPGGNRERAATAATKAIDLLGDDRLQRAQANLVLAGLEDDADKQRQLLDAAVEFSPRDVEVRRSRGLFHYQQEEFEKARADLAVAIEEDGDDESLQEALGMACMMSDHFDEARAAFGRALEIDPESSGALLQRARVNAIQGKNDEAFADIDRVIDIRPEDPRAALMQQQARLLRARIRQQLGESDEALMDVETVLERDDENAAALEIKGLIAAERENYPEAIRTFRKLVQLNRDDPVTLSQLGMLYLAAKQPREAIRRFTKAIDIDADSFPSRRGRSDAEISIGDHAAALTDLEKAHALKPDDTGILNNLAWLLATSPDDAIRNADRAIELATKACEGTEWKEGHIISTLAAGHAEKGDFEKAKEYSRKAVQTAETNEEVKEQLKGELASYEAGKPWRERQEMPEAGDSQPSEGESKKKKTPAGDADRDSTPRRPFDE